MLDRRDRPVVTPERPEPAPPVEPEAVGQRRRLSSAAAIFGIATGISRVLGLVREIVVRNYFGVAGDINSFTVAFQVPNLIRALVADIAFTSAFVPVFSELLVKGERRRAWAVASSLFWIMLLGLGGITALCILLAPLIIAPFGIPVGTEDLTVTLTRILFPTVTLLGVSGVFVGLLNSYERFTIPALTPVAWNVAIIAGLVFGVPRADSEDGKLYVYAGAVVVGTLIQVLLPLPWLRGLDGRLRAAVNWRDPAVKRVFVLMLPVTIGLGLINFNAFVDTLFASRLLDPSLAPAAIDAAFRLYMLPQGLFSVAVATVLFPSLSRFAASGDMRRFRQTVGAGLRQIAFLLVPASVACAVLAEPIVRLVYQRGAFTAAQTNVVAACLAAFSLGLTFNGAMLLLNRSFFGLQSPWLPTTIALANLGLNGVLDLSFYRLGIWGIPLATSIVNIAGATALAILLRRRVGDIEVGRTLAATLRIVVAGGVLAAAAWGIWNGLDSVLGSSFFEQLVAVGGALAAGAVVYVAACWALGVEETRPLLRLVGLRRAR
jgi:putative peptidoglycan lipid II flippase